MNQLISIFEENLIYNSIIAGLFIILMAVTILAIRKINSQALRLKLIDKMANNQIELPSVINKMSIATLKLSYGEIINYFVNLFNKANATETIKDTLYWIKYSVKEAKKNYLMFQLNEVTRTTVSLERIAAILSEAVIAEAKTPGLENSSRNIKDFILEYISKGPNDLIKTFVTEFEKNISVAINQAGSKESIKIILAGELAKVQKMLLENK